MWVHTMEDFAVLMLFGVRVREVHDLEEGAVFLPESALLFVDDAMRHHERDLMCCQILARVDPFAA